MATSRTASDKLDNLIFAVIAAVLLRLGFAFNNLICVSDLGKEIAPDATLKQRSLRSKALGNYYEVQSRHRGCFSFR
jgi:hypothetical protein